MRRYRLKSLEWLCSQISELAYIRIVLVHSSGVKTKTIKTVRGLEAFELVHRNPPKGLEAPSSEIGPMYWGTLKSFSIRLGIQWETSTLWHPKHVHLHSRGTFWVFMVDRQLRIFPNNIYQKRSFKGCGDSYYGNSRNRKSFKQNG